MKMTWDENYYTKYSNLGGRRQVLAPAATRCVERGLADAPLPKRIDTGQLEAETSLSERHATGHGSHRLLPRLDCCWLHQLFLTGLQPHTKPHISASFERFACRLGSGAFYWSALSESKLGLAEYARETSNQLAWMWTVIFAVRLGICILCCLFGYMSRLHLCRPRIYIIWTFFALT